ncbi:Ectonucleoside triphosphate diphosphohydrolase [Seminavis robusta]|uniref:Ectonucleoside triphosphate diphosphohydrolase n=1 Tax=Seminavis robusta TaxID=568900 RepID=A0A9N8EIB1_9STRA|nr:Ectonucleoside triphosphate diphosphohydrolase [Seminavis robusta]|eukprot:Sro1241_g255390.1 Ectonucleoside triphosphate diphosphohydrolase (643) ;mRNA; f:4094-6475
MIAIRCFLALALSIGLASAVRHPLEESISWELHVRRLEGGEEEPEDEEDTPYTIKHKKPKNHIPFAGGDTTHGMMIDAGSQGTRLHIFEWGKRILLDQEDLLDVAHGKKLSIPTSNSRWTDKYTPGLDKLAYHKKPAKLTKALRNYLGPLLDFAKKVLKDKEHEWHTYPIYLKATGGLRTLPKKDRVRLIEAIRDLFNQDKTFNPFAFEDEQCRVISGEEEAIYGWVGVNFAKGSLIDYSYGEGDATIRKHRQLTYGMLEMGGASTQIAVYENNGDLMANLFKLQLGGSRHWNVYVHSYLYFGINGAWTRLGGRLHWEGTTTNPCLPIGSEVEFSSWATMDQEGRFYPRSANESQPYSVTMVNNNTAFDYSHCAAHTNWLLRNDANQEWCEFEMDGNCGFAGIYQPPMPQVNRDIDEFVATSNFVDVFRFLKLGDRASVSQIGQAAEKVCALNWEEVKDYNSNLKDSPVGNDDEHTLAQMCFRSVFVYQLLRNGWAFGDDYELTAADVINGQKMGWALGCMLYEINTLPWDFHPELLYRGPDWWLITLYVIIGTLGGGAIGFAIAMRTSKKFNKRVRQSVFFQNSALLNNPTVRKSLSCPPLDLEELLKEEEYALHQQYSDEADKLAEEEALIGDDNGTKYT